MASADTPAWIIRPLREKGAPIPRFVWAAGEEDARVGYLVIDWEDSDVHRRRMKLARVTSAGKDLLPPLRDVKIIRYVGRDLTITGFEQVEDREYAQSWYCRLWMSGWLPRGKPSEGVGHIRD